VAATDILTLEEARLAIRQGAAVTANDVEIAALITAVSIRLDAEDGIGPVVARTVTAETHDGGMSLVALRHRPVLSVSAVVEDGTTLTSSDYHLDAEAGLLVRRSGSHDDLWEHGRGNVTVTYVAGRFNSTALVDEYYREGARLLFKHLWRSREWSPPVAAVGDFEIPQQSYPAMPIPFAVIDWFGAEWRGHKRAVGFA